MRLTSISIYPIKGTRAIALQEAEVRTRGLVSDRRWLVVDESGQFITQRTHPRIGLVSSTVRDNGDLIVTAPDMEPMPVAARGSAERVTVTVWDDTIQAARVSEEADRWFSRFLEMNCCLAFMDQTALRPVAPQYGQPGDEVSFADAVPLLLANDASLIDLNERLAQPLPMTRFRPNITVDGETPWDEDNWKRLRVGSVEFEVTHRCAVRGHHNRPGHAGKVAGWRAAQDARHVPTRFRRRLFRPEPRAARTWHHPRWRSG